MAIAIAEMQCTKDAEKLGVRNFPPTSLERPLKST